MGDGFEYPDALADGARRGRGAGLNPGNRYEAARLHVCGDFLDGQRQAAADAGESADRDGAGRLVSLPTVAHETRVIADHSRTIINRLDPAKSPDIPFRFSINPYRGCEHGCIYCYARPGHEQLGYSCGLDFESKIVAKLDAPRLLRKELASPKWRPETISMAGVTDVYQPIEGKLRLTRGCLEVLAECRQPVGLVTKNRLILRDLDLLAELAGHQAVCAAISITTLDNQLAAKMEPRASSPGERLATIRALSEAGVRTLVMVAPIIPGLTDREIPAILEAAADAGARGAGYVLLRLPYQIKALFEDWLRRHFPDRTEHVLSLVRQTRDGKLYDSRPGKRMRGEGEVAGQVGRMFEVFVRRYGLRKSHPPLSAAHFRPPAPPPSDDGQLTLF